MALNTAIRVLDSRVSRQGVRFKQITWQGVAMAALPQIPAAQYLRMSTDLQKLSLAYQVGTIQQYADTHGFKIIQSYEDRGRSGLTLKQRLGLAQLHPKRP